MSFLKKVLPNTLDNIINYSILTILIVILLVGVYMVYDGVYVYYLSNNNSLVYSNVKENVEEVKVAYPDAIGWLHIEETIDEPLMQGVDNLEYLNKGPDGKYSLRGSLYLDSRNNKDFTDDYMLIYGHHMSNYQMFGALDRYLNKEWWSDKNHLTGEILIDDDTTLSLRILAVGSVDTSVPEIFQPTEVSIEDVVKFIKNHKWNTDDIGGIDLENKQILCMSTCQTPDSTLRTCIICIID